MFEQSIAHMHWANARIHEWLRPGRASAEEHAILASHIVTYRMFSGSPGSTSIGDMIQHAFTHGFHHAGQMAALASRNGEKFPDVSYIGFTRK